MTPPIDTVAVASIVPGQNACWASPINVDGSAPALRLQAACILNLHSEAVAHISISGPTPRMPDARIREIGLLVSEATRKISRQMGAD